MSRATQIVAALLDEADLHSPSEKQALKRPFAERENYPSPPMSSGAKEAVLRRKRRPIARPKASFYPSSGGPSSM